MTKKKKVGSCLGLLLIPLVGAALFIGQRHYIRHHLPLIEKELAVANGEGLARLNAIPLPEGSTPRTEGEKLTSEGRRSSMWQDTPVAISWQREWDAPGTPADHDQWFAERLVAEGWRPFVHGIPTTVQSLWWKEKWLLTIQKRGDFSTDRPPHARFVLLLQWDYWHNLEDDRVF